MDFDSLVADSEPQQPISATLPPQQPMADNAGDFDSLVDDSEKHSTPLETAKTFGEGALSTTLGPLAPVIEQSFEADPKDILARQEANPIAHGLGQAAGLTAGMLTGTGEAALMEGAGKLATEAAGLAAPVSRLAKVGSAAIQQAAEMAVLQSGDEASKMILKDPNTSAESAIANIGLSTALGAAGGAFITGAVSPLWDATAGKALSGALTKIQDHMNGGIGKLAPEAEMAAKDLGVTIPSEIRGANSTGTGRAGYADLKRMENSSILNAEAKLNKDVSDSVAGSLGVDTDSVLNYSENEHGHALADAFKKEYKTKYEDFDEAFKARNAEAATIAVSDDAKLELYDNIINKAINDIGTDSPYYKIYSDYGNRMLAKDTVGGLDNLATEINNKVKGMTINKDFNEVNALNDLRRQLRDFQKSQIISQSKSLEKEGVEYGSALGRDLVKEREALHQRWGDFAKMSDELNSHLGVGGFKGAGTTEKKLTEMITPEQLLKKFSLRNNADIIPFLEQHFPDTLQAVKAAELKNLIKPAVLSAKEGAEINTARLSKIINDGMAGHKGYIEALLSPEAIRKIQAAETIKGIIPGPRDSGTPAGLIRNLSAIPATAFGMLAAVIGHNPIVGGILGHLGHVLSRDGVDAGKLALLRFAGSDQPISAPGFKAALDFLQNTIKGQNNITKATKAVLGSSAQVLTDKMMPFEADRAKLDKQVTKYQDKPATALNLAKGSTGHYFPQHQTALTESTTRALQYLQSIKPQPFRSSPLDKEIEPSKAEMARYNRALDIANAPVSVLQHVKDGTIQPSDILDLHSMYPSLYAHMAQQLSNQMINRRADEEPIPYKTRIGMSLFLGQALDSTMTPSAIMAAQPKPKEPMPQQSAPMKGRKGKSALGKTNDDYQTPGQAAEHDRSSRN